MRERPNRTVSKTVVPPGTVGSNPTPSALTPFSGWITALQPVIHPENDDRPLARPQRPRSLLGCRSSLGVWRLHLDVAVGHGDATACAAGDVLVVGQQHNGDAFFVAEPTQQPDEDGG